MFSTSSDALVANVNITDVDHLSDHCLITADVVGRVPKTGHHIHITEDPNSGRSNV